MHPRWILPIAVLIATTPASAQQNAARDSAAVRDSVAAAAAAAEEVVQTPDSVVGDTLRRDSVAAAPLPVDSAASDTAAADTAAAPTAGAGVGDPRAVGSSQRAQRAPADTTRLERVWRRRAPQPLQATERIARYAPPPRRAADESGVFGRSLERAMAARTDSLWVRSQPGRRVAEEVVSDAPVQLKGAAARAAAAQQAAAALPDTVQYLPAEQIDTTENALPDALDQYARLGLQVAGRGDLGGEWQRFEPCDATLGPGRCEAGLVPQLQPDVQFGVLLGGTVTDRIHVAVDYDQRREFDASNNINVYYQGLEDEILQRVEVGDVAISLPQSRFMGTGVPGGNFGFRALADFGPLEVQAVWAQQRGDVGSRELELGGAGTGGLFEDEAFPLDDVAYVSGRFFFLVDPTQLPGYPHVDVLELRQGDAPAQLAPNGSTLQLYRDEQVNPQQQTGAQYFFAEAAPPDASADTISGRFRRLSADEYVVHSSGLWLMLTRPLGENETIALSYVTTSGDTVGTINAETASQTGRDPVLRLLRGPVTTSHLPGAPTWEYEMHQVYSLSNGDVDPEEVELEIRLGDPATGRQYVDFQGEQIPYLQLLGLDENQPAGRVDPERIFLPSEFADPSSRVTGTYLVFPTLRPFADPGPVPSAGLDSLQARTALGADTIPHIYDATDPSTRRSGRYKLLVEYRLQADGLQSEFNLGAFGIREGSERIMIDNQALIRGSDYEIDYETGVVRLIDPQDVFSGRPNARIRATYEQNALFEVAPKSLFGTTVRYALGERGELNFMGLYQGERSIMSRPQLGSEPTSIWMGGVNGNLSFGAGWMDRALDVVPGLRLGGESRIDLTGELAMSAPDPNTLGVAWLEDFEATAELPLTMSQRAWQLGSRPSTTFGAEQYLPVSLDVANASGIVWQHQYVSGSAVGGSMRPEMIDEAIRTAGRRTPEPVMYVTMRPDSMTDGGTREWRSLTTLVSARGADLTTSEFLEFYVAEPPDTTGLGVDTIALVIDIGRVGEDAFYFDSTGATFGTHPLTGLPWGLGVLDQEADIAAGEIWSRQADQRGLWGQTCVSDPGRVYSLGSRSANCTVNNGVPDSEDLNGDGVPDLDDGPYFRYVVKLGSDAPEYLARDTTETGTPFRLYRIPLRGPDALPINGATDDTWRRIQHVRVTTTRRACDSRAGASCRAQFLTFARMRITGSRWEKRQVHGVLAGEIGEEALPGAQQAAKLSVGPISQITDVAYTPPPGVQDEAQDASAGVGLTAIQINEKALRVRYTDLDPDARGEIFYRFPQEARSLMDYRQARLWALPVAGDWGAGGSQRLLVKLGTDGGNYYLYRTPLRSAVAAPATADWLPEVVIEFEPWYELKAQAERLALQADTGVVLWNADSTHAIVLRGRSQAPNLAAIRDLSFAVHNSDGLPATGEVWLNDFRLSSRRQDGGFAGHLALTAQASDFATLQFTFGDQSALFQQMNRAPQYQGIRDMGVNGRFQLGHFAPAGWGLAMPLTVSHTRAGSDPFFLSSSDIEASRLDGLRDVGTTRTQVGLSIDKATPSANPLVSLLVDPVTVDLGYTASANDNFVSSTDADAFTGTLAYDRQVPRRAFDVTPGFWVGLLQALFPARLEQSELFRRMTTAELRWSPTNVRIASTYGNQDSRQLNYGSVLALPGDSAVRPVESPRETLRNTASVGVQPFESLNARVSVSQERDLLPPETGARQEEAREAIRDARGSLAGMDIGWEMQRSLQGSVQFQPRLAAWLQPSVAYTTNYSTSRSPNYLTEVDGRSRMQRNFQVDGALSRSLRIDPQRFVESVWGAQPRGEEGFALDAARFVGRSLRPVEMTWLDDTESSYERADFEPGYGYRIAWGGLDRLRTLESDTADVAGRRDSFETRSGIVISRSLELQVAYAEVDQLSLNSQGGRNHRTERYWPDLRLRVSQVPIPAAAQGVLSSVSAGTGYRIGDETTRLNGGVRGGVSTTIPVDFTAAFANGITAVYNASFTDVDGRETTGRTERDERTHDVSLRGMLPAPTFVHESFTEPLRATIGYGYRTQSQCRVQTAIDGTTSCVHWIDNITRSGGITLETMLGRLSTGLQLSYNDRQSFIGRREGGRFFQLGIFANFNFGVGTLPADLLGRGGSF